jgi:hypothetical protein
MATSTTISTTYAGEFAGQYIAAALLEGSTIANGGITVKPNVKLKEVIKKVSVDDIVKNGTCDFDSTSALSLTERILTPKELQVNLQLCKKDFVQDWEAIQMGYSAYSDLPPSFSDFLIGHVAAKVAQRTENSIWTGLNASNGQFDGLTSLLAADALLPTANEVTGTTITALNVIDELGKIVDAIPSTIYGKEDLYIYVSQNIARAYVRALGGFGAAGLGANGVNAQGTQWWNNGALSFDGVKLFVANGLADNTAVAVEKSNIFFGTGLLSDHNLVKVLDMADLDGSQNVRVIMRFTAGVQYGVVEDIVTYGIVNAAN